MAATGLSAHVQRSTLDVLTSTQDAIIIALDGRREFVSRLATLRFVPGARIDMVQNYGDSPLIVRVQRARIALGRAEAHNVVIERRNLS